MNIEIARRQMIEQQVRAWEVLDDRVLGALAQVRREIFVPQGYRELAFADTQIPLGQGQCMLAPKVEGRFLQALELTPADQVLEIGTGSGFFAACLSRLAGSVRSVEIFAELSDFARENLRASGVSGVQVETRDALTLDDSHRYGAIAVTASLPVYDARFERALEVGGRLVVVVGEPPVMEARLVRRASETQWVQESLFETVIAPLVNAPQPPRFLF
ncbi:MAG TPA: protein-L-isoaspartate O-methyltransferase [Steroidobacteraceae bacterium]|jgi:protein-L-isoaspartate(D-aspartate) O-methyltransferase|nr:protein-L-isoaspartate O-methyltransferase [Steroidobacteraceae bacterium]